MRSQTAKVVNNRVISAIFVFEALGEVRPNVPPHLTLAVFFVALFHQEMLLSFGFMSFGVVELCYHVSGCLLSR